MKVLEEMLIYQLQEEMLLSGMFQAVQNYQLPVVILFLKVANGKVEASTAAGNINLKNIEGSIEASTAAGNIYAELHPEGNIQRVN